MIRVILQEATVPDATTFFRKWNFKNHPCFCDDLICHSKTHSFFLSCTDSFLCSANFRDCAVVILVMINTEATCVHCAPLCCGRLGLHLQCWRAAILGTLLHAGWSLREETLCLKTLCSAVAFVFTWSAMKSFYLVKVRRTVCLL